VSEHPNAISTEEYESLKKAFDRKEVCLLGLPFDVVDEGGAADILKLSIEKGQRCFLSTPNLNFVIAAMRDTYFRDSVLVSDLSVADGMPLIWISRLLGLPLPERVAGSSLFERMRTHNASTKIKVFFFGGLDTVAEDAVEALNLDSPGMSAVGSYNPGFGSVEEMSKASIIDEINAIQPDFLVVSLGAKKGQSWILANQSRLNAAVVSHLGAVVNFVAGTVERAPGLWQKLGLEWVWRIIEEPNLWKRYLCDGLELLRILASRIAPLVIYDRVLSKKYRQVDFTFDINTENNRNILVVSGAARFGELEALKYRLPECIQLGLPLTVDLSALVYADASFWALLLRIQAEANKQGISTTLEHASPALKRLLRLHMLDGLLRIQS